MKTLFLFILLSIVFITSSFGFCVINVDTLAWKKSDRLSAILVMYKAGLGAQAERLMELDIASGDAIKLSKGTKVNMYDTVHEIGISVITFPGYENIGLSLPAGHLDCR